MKNPQKLWQTLKKFDYPKDAGIEIPRTYLD